MKASNIFKLIPVFLYIATSAVPTIADIRGQNSVLAFDMIRDRGFNNVDSFNSGNSSYRIFYNRRTQQYVQITNADGRVYDIRDIGQHPNCR